MSYCPAFEQVIHKNLLHLKLQLIKFKKNKSEILSQPLYNVNNMQYIQKYYALKLL